LPFGPGEGQAVQELVPQFAGSVLLTHVPLQLWEPPLHMTPQLVPSQVAFPFGPGEGQAVHELVPQFAMSELLTHTLAQSWNVALQVKPQTLLMQVAFAFAGGLQSLMVQQPQLGMQLPVPPAPGQNFSPAPQVQVLLVQVAVPPQSLGPLQQPLAPVEVKPQLPSTHAGVWQPFPVEQGVEGQQLPPTITVQLHV
jgi:hypothetical protein